jgi:isochorismate synthase
VSASLSELYAAGTPAEDALARSLGLALEDVARAGGTTLVSLPAPLAPAETLLAGHAGDAVAWAAPGDFELAALGSAEVVEGHGETRFRSVTAAAREVFARTRSVGALGVPAVTPRLFGGFSFRPQAPRSEIWKPFGEGRFVLPELAYQVEAGSARLLLAVTARRADRRSSKDELVETVRKSLAALESPLAVDRAEARVPITTRERPAEEWAALVEAIRGEIAGGALEKVVLARRVAVELAEEPDPALVLARLRLEAPQCTRFLLRRGNVAFVGATPERLAQKRGSTLETEAVAGSMSARDREGAERLLASGKDLAEHAFVLKEILRALEPVARDIQHAERPELYELRHVLHLRSRVRATLSGSPHLLELVERLHPTPAVGGVPTARALEWIGAHEPDERGFYAGPIGWFDAAGDGEMAVALRSGVLEGKTAHLYVGSGIVERSAPAAELTETRWKLAALLGALGVSE